MAAPSQQQQPGLRLFTSRHSLPSEWDRRHWGRHQHVQEYLKVEGLTVKYVGPGETDSQAATIFADQPVPADVPLFYFEATVVSGGEHGYIGIGYCVDSVNLGRLPGWEPHSYGYHGDDGHAFHGSGQGRAYGPGFGSGDVIGALLDRDRNTISYYKNGQSVGVAFYDVKEQQLYPCVGLRTKHEEVRANFGGSAFTADLARLQAEFRDRVLADILAVPLPASAELQVPQLPAAPAGGQPPPPPLPASASPWAAPPPAAAGADAQQQQQQQQVVPPLAPIDMSLDAWAAQLLAARAAGAQQAPAAAGAAGGATDKQQQQQLAAAGGSGGKASQPLMPLLVFNYLLHRRCWKTAAVVARDMLAAADSAAAAAAAAAAADGPVGMDSSGGGAGAGDDQPMPDAAGASSSQPHAAAGGGDAQPSSSATLLPSAAMGQLSQADIQDALLRQKIYETICSGRIADGLAAVATHYGQQVLDGTPRLAFKLRVQQFVELVRQAGSSSGGGDGSAAGTSNGAAASAAAGGAGSAGTSTSSFEAALAYGRSELGPSLKSPEDEELLSDALSLLAYADPAASPCGHLLRESSRAELAEELNGALLKARGSSGRPLLESLYRQTAVLVDELKRQGLPAALVLDVPGLCCEPPAAPAPAAGGAGPSDMQS